MANTVPMAEPTLAAAAADLPDTARLERSWFRVNADCAQTVGASTRYPAAADTATASERPYGARAASAAPTRRTGRLAGPHRTRGRDASPRLRCPRPRRS